LLTLRKMTFGFAPTHPPSGSASNPSQWSGLDRKEQGTWNARHGEKFEARFLSAEVQALSLCAIMKLEP
jgi:hypothetical protein